MPSLNLSPIEARVLGCLLEKERTVPENYPLSLNSLTNACNQSTNRDPVTTYEERQVERALESLRERQLASMIMGAGSRVQKYRHKLGDHFELNRGETAIITVLLLRGAQTPGELRARTDRLNSFGDVTEVETCLAGLAAGGDPLVQILPARPGQKERRYVELLSVPPDPATLAAAAAPVEVPLAAPAPSRVDQLESEVRTLRTELDQLKSDFAAFQSQFK